LTCWGLLEALPKQTRPWASPARRSTTNVIVTLDNCESGSLFGCSKCRRYGQHMQKKNLHDSSLSHKHARQSPVGAFKQASGVGKVPALGRHMPARRDDPGDHCFSRRPLAARHAWQKAPWDRQAESTKRNMTVLGGRVASTCMLYFAKTRSIPECIQHDYKRGLWRLYPGDQGPKLIYVNCKTPIGGAAPLIPASLAIRKSTCLYRIREILVPKS